VIVLLYACDPTILVFLFNFNYVIYLLLCVNVNYMYQNSSVFDVMLHVFSIVFLL
jgi:hypothetical protein